MSALLHILMLEDSATDAELNERLLRKAGLDFDALRVEDRAGFLAALAEFRPDLILADYSLPGFDGLEALGLAREQAPDTPFLFVTGSLGEERAVESLKHGAVDYILKDRLARLPASVQRALQEKRLAAERRAAAAQVREQALFLESLLEAIPIPVYYKDTQGRYLGCNLAYEEAVGKGCEELVGKTVFDLAPAEAAAEQHALDTPLFQRPGTQEYPWTVHKPSGEVRELVFHKASFLRADGSIGGLIGAAVDVTKIRQQETALRTSEERFRVATDSVRDAFVILEAEGGRVTWWNAAAEAIFGYSHAEMLGQPLHEGVVPLRYREAAGRGMARFAASGEGAALGRTLELMAQRKGGEEFPVELSLSAMQLDGKWYAVGIARDITERKRAEQKLASSRESYHQLFESMGSGVAIYQPDASGEHFVIKAVNQAVERIEGVGREALLGRDVEEAFPGIVTMGLLEVFRRVARTGQPEHLPARLYRDAQRSGWRENHVYRLSGGEVVAVYEDVSERVEREAQIGRLNRILRTVSACNEDLVRARSEPDLLNAVCRDLVGVGGYLLAWVAYPEPDGSLRAMQHHGNTAIFAHHQALEDDPEHLRHCLLHTAWHERRTVTCNRLRESDECRFDSLATLGVGGALALPLIGGDGALGVLAVFAAASDAFGSAEVKLMEELAADLAYGIVALRTAADRDHHLARYGQAMQGAVTAIARTLEMRDPYTSGHQQRVANLAVAIAREMGLDDQRVEGLYFGGIIHDIGKIAVPAEILVKPSLLTDIEFMLIQDHPRAGHAIVKDIEFPWPVAEMVLQHHERLDGSGYPQGLKGEEILLEARILAVADVVEAMSSHRPYRPSLGLEPALAEIGKGMGNRYDPVVAEACLRLFREKGYSLDK